MSKNILLLAALLLGANNIYAHNPGAVKKLLPVFKLFGIDPSRTMTVHDSLAELEKRPYPFKFHVEKHAKLYLPDWTETEKLTRVFKLYAHADAGVLPLLMEIASENRLLAGLDEIALALPPDEQKKLRSILRPFIAGKHWWHTVKVTRDGRCILGVKDNRDGSECSFTIKCGDLSGERLTAICKNSDINVGYWSGREWTSDFKCLFTVRYDIVTNTWFETGSTKEIRTKTPAVSEYKEIRRVPVCTAVVNGKKVYKNLQIRGDVRKFKVSEIKFEDIIQAE